VRCENATATARRQGPRFYTSRAAMTEDRLWRYQGKRNELAICLLQSTAGSPKGLIRAI
jgi:hypothetical protein